MLPRVALNDTARLLLFGTVTKYLVNANNLPILLAPQALSNSKTYIFQQPGTGQGMRLLLGWKRHSLQKALNGHTPPRSAGAAAGL